MTRFRFNPGELRHIIYFQKQSEIQDEYGEDNEVWVDTFKTRAGVFPISGKSFIAAKGETSEITHKIQVRFEPNNKISPDMRIKFGERIFEITAPPINFQENNHLLEIMCKEVIGYA